MLTNIFEIDIQILSSVKDLDTFPKNKYVDNILNDNNFWKLRLYNIHTYSHTGSIDYKSVVQFLDSTNENPDRKYFRSSNDMFKQLINLETYNNPLYLLTYVNVSLENLRTLTSPCVTYDEFISRVIFTSRQNFRYMIPNKDTDKLFNNISMSYDDLAEYLNKITYKHDNITICIPESNNVESLQHIIKLHHKNGFTNGILLYELAKVLPENTIVHSNYVTHIFDGLYYDNGIYNLLNYTNKLLYSVFYSGLCKSKTFDVASFSGFDI